MMAGASVVGALAGGALGGVLTSLFGWASVFWALVPLALAVAIAAPRVLPTDPRNAGLSGFDLPGAALATGGALLLVFGISRIQEDVRTGVGVIALGVVAMLGSAFLLPRLLDRWSVRRILLVGVLGVAVTSGAFAWAVSGDHYWMVLPSVVLLGLTASTVYPAVFAAAGAEIDDAGQGVASATVSTAQQLGGAVGLAALVAVAGTGGGLTAASLAGGAALTVVAFLALAIRGGPTR
ncbi:Probable major facilitator superfamily (MFS) transporter [Nocardiopsis sp. JB363]|nr:Probable major facilitator superfamily (MFS) transporter [Nocardiopsis sp. JB363]